MATLQIKDVHAQVDGKEILKGINLEIHSGETHALMGPNGNGKSTLLAVIMGNPKFQVTSGEILYDGKDVLQMSVDERSRAGLFLGMQYPSEVSGVTNSDFLRAAMNARTQKPVSLFKFIKAMEGAIEQMEMKADLAHRFLNEGFSGGEKKRNEIVQMMMLKPNIAMLDEIDSGLDVDALKIVASAILQMQKDQDMALLVVSHYERFYDLLKPTHAHVLIDGKIVVSGGVELTHRIDTQGYEWIAREYGVQITDEKENTATLLGSCATKQTGV